MNEPYDIVAVGGGLAGISAALAASHAGYRTALVAPDNNGSDGRTTALMMPSISLLEELGVWTSLCVAAAPLRSMRILDGTSRLLRAPTVTFQASELGLEAFGYNIPNASLLDSLKSAVSDALSIDHITQSVVGLSLGSDAAVLHLSGGADLETRLVAAADGRGSLLRQFAGIPVRDWTYPQAALVLNFSHELAHSDTSNEFHTEDGPFTQVPLPGRKSSLVWAMKPDAAGRHAALPPEELARRVEKRMASMLGKVSIDGSVQQFKFSGMIAESFARDRILLIGEAGHAFPPIGAQGLNLGLRDVVDMVEALQSCGDLGNLKALCDRYNRLRRLDVTSRTFGVDMLNRSLLSGLLPVQFARSAGLSLLRHFSPLRQIVMREGVKPGSGFRSGN